MRKSAKSACCERERTITGVGANDRERRPRIDTLTICGLKVRVLDINRILQIIAARDPIVCRAQL